MCRISTFGWAARISCAPSSGTRCPAPRSDGRPGRSARGRRAAAGPRSTAEVQVEDHHGIESAIPASSAERAPHALGGQRELAKAHAGEPGERIAHRRAHGDEAALARALGAEGAGAVAVLDEHAAQARGQVEGAGHAVVDEVRVQELAAVVDHLLVEGVAEPLHHRALVLALALLGIDAAADVGHRDVVARRPPRRSPRRRAPRPRPPPSPRTACCRRAAPRLRPGATMPRPISSPPLMPKRSLRRSGYGRRAPPGGRLPLVELDLGAAARRGARPRCAGADRARPAAASSTARPIMVVERLELVV